jgi:prophage regulatory protein
VTSKPSLEVMGAAEIGRLLGVSRQRVQQLVKTKDFPEPAAVLDMGKIWHAADVHDWIRRSRPAQAAPVAADGQDDPDAPLDVEQAFLRRHGDDPAQGRDGALPLSRPGWDGLRRLAEAGALTDHQVLMTVSLLTRAGRGGGRDGIVLGNDVEMARALGMHPNRVKGLWEALEALGLGMRLVLPKGGRAGWRFSPQAWRWLVGGDEGAAPPEQVAAVLGNVRAAEG